MSNFLLKYFRFFVKIILLMKKKNANCKFPLARIKKIIQQNEEIGKVSHSIPFLVEKSVEKAKEGDASKLIPSHLKAIIEADPKYAFLSETVKEVPSLSDAQKPAKKPKNTNPTTKKRKNSKKAGEDEESGSEDDEGEEKMSKKVKS